MKTIVRSTVCAAVLLANAPVAGFADDLPAGQSVYSKAVAAMRELQIPRYLRYRVRGEHHGLSLYFVMSGRHVYLNASPIFDGRDFTGHGTARYDSSDGSGVFTDSAGKDVVGCVPFPLGPEVRAFVRTGSAESAVADTAPSPQPTPSPSASAAEPPIDVLGKIGSARAFYSKAYDIADAGIETVDDAPAYHLKFTARDGDTTNHPVTDVYVDAKSYLVRSVILGGGQRGLLMGGGGSGRFDFGSFGEYWLVKHVHVEAAGHFLLAHKGGSLDYFFDGYTFPSSLPPMW